MKRYDIFITEQQLKDLNTLYLSTGIKIAKIIREAIDEYLTRNLHTVNTQNNKYMCDNCECETEHDNNSMCVECKYYD